MLDVHPPEHAAHSWRDFIIHIATIVVGLLIAVALEQGVESLHHRHEVMETRARITEELESDRRLIAQNARQLRQDSARWTEYGVRLTEDGVSVEEVERMNFSWDLDLESNSAWEVAKESAAFPYMNADETEQYDYFYRLLAENYATSVLYIADVRSADAVVQRVRSTHTLNAADRARLLVMSDSLVGRARNQLDLYAYLDSSLNDWLDHHHLARRS